MDSNEIGLLIALCVAAIVIIAVVLICVWSDYQNTRSAERIQIAKLHAEEARAFKDAGV